MSVDKEIRKTDSERIIPVIKLLIGDRKVYEVERAAGIGNGIIGKIMRGERFPSSITIKKLTSPEANPQNGVTYEKLMIAAGYMLPPGMQDIEMAGGASIDLSKTPPEGQKERLMAYQKKMHQIEVDNAVRKIFEMIKKNAQENISEETMKLLAYREYSYACCKGLPISEELLNLMAERALDNKYE